MASLLKVDPEVKLKVDSFRERITSEAEDLVANFFPKKLLELDGFLKEPILNIHDLTQIHSDMNLPVPDPILLTNSHDGLDGPNMKKRKLEEREETFQGTKVFVMPNGMLKSNQQLVDIIEKVKPEIRLLIEKCNTVGMGGSSACWGRSASDPSEAKLRGAAGAEPLCLCERGNSQFLSLSRGGWEVGVGKCSFSEPPGGSTAHLAEEEEVCFAASFPEAFLHPPFAQSDACWGLLWHSQESFSWEAVLVLACVASQPRGKQSAQKCREHRGPAGVDHELRGKGRALGGLERRPVKILALICSVISPLQVKMWVQLLIPRIEDGNNFGVSIQEETVAELRTVESEAASYLDQISRYYITRAKLVSKIAKYPHVEDYRRTVTEIDEKEYISLRLIISELRNQYVTLHDMILKNIEKIKRPRSSNAETLY
ncbi:proteasome activator complex subunit 3 isoform X1 [Cygnus atratus]|uniref:proteasome activator complex subunit 3 isoform X1 n=1 Tax=Cygnus atratus TaxID=8868 RepID=UPI0015D5DDA8|nr:proteasome activator complex subunit 3 isoform X1 [Cygnus atratus]